MVRDRVELDDEGAAELQLAVSNEASVDRWARYQSTVRRKPSSSSNIGAHPSTERAFLALRYWQRISLVASSRTSGSSVESMTFRIALTMSSTLIGCSVEK